MTAPDVKLVGYLQRVIAFNTDSIKQSYRAFENHCLLRTPESHSDWEDVHLLGHSVFG